MNIKRTLLIIVGLTTITSAAAIAAAGAPGHREHGPAPFELFGPQVVKQLHLNSSQNQALDKIQAERKAVFTRLREQHQALKKSMQTTLETENPDLRALFRESNAAMDQVRDSMRKIQGEELNLYDTLDSQQKKVVSAALLKRLSRMGQHRGWKHGHSRPQESGSNPAPGI